MQSKRPAGSVHGQEPGFYWNDDREAAGKSVLAQVLNSSRKGHQTERIGAEAEWKVQRLTGYSQVAPSGRGCVRSLAAAVCCPKVGS